MLRIQPLTKLYGEMRAVDDLNLHIAPGEPETSAEPEAPNQPEAPAAPEAPNQPETPDEPKDGSENGPHF